MRKTIITYLDRAKKKLGSDYRLAQELDVTRQAISHARRRNSLGIVNCIALATILGVPPAEVIEANIWQKERKARLTSVHARSSDDA